MLKLKLQYFGHLMWRVDSLEKTDAGRDWGQEEKGTTEDEMVGWHHRLDGHEFGWTRELVMDIEAWPSVIHGVTKSRTWLSIWTGWTDTACTCLLLFFSILIISVCHFMILQSAHNYDLCFFIYLGGLKHEFDIPVMILTITAVPAWKGMRLHTSSNTIQFPFWQCYGFHA